MKIIILDKTEEKTDIRKTVSDCVCKLGDTTNIIVGSCKPLHEIFSEIKALRADFILSFDDTALMFKGELGGCSLNRIPSKVIHFITNEESIEAFSEDVVLNLSHCVLLTETVKNDFARTHEMIPNVYSYAENSLEEDLKRALKEMWCL